jgi:hypothetical protein
MPSQKARSDAEVLPECHGRMAPQWHEWQGRASGRRTVSFPTPSAKPRGRPTSSFERTQSIPACSSRRFTPVRSRGQSRCFRDFELARGIVGADRQLATCRFDRVERMIAGSQPADLEFAWAPPQPLSCKSQATESPTIRGFRAQNVRARTTQVTLDHTDPYASITARKNGLLRAVALARPLYSPRNRSSHEVRLSRPSRSI